MIEVKNADFRRALALAGKVVEKRCTIPILEQVRCRANGALQVTGTDLDMTITATVPVMASVPEQQFMLPAARQVMAAMGHAGGAAVAIQRGGDAEGRSIRLSASAVELELKETCQVEDYPHGLDPVEQVFSATFSAAHIASLARVASAMSKEGTRYYLHGVYFHHVADWTYRAVATDGHRLQMVDLELPDAFGANPTERAGFLLPRKLIALLMDKALTGGSAVRLVSGPGVLRNRDVDTAPEARSATRVRFTAEPVGAAVEIASKLIDGTFPDYQRVVPQSTEKHALVKVADLRRAINVISVGASSSVRAIKLTFGEDGLRVSAAYVDLGLSAKVDMPCKHDCIGFEIGFNGSYLLAMLAAAQGEEISLAMTDAMAPTLIRNPADTAWAGVLMPMRY